MNRGCACVCVCYKSEQRHIEQGKDLDAIEINLHSLLTGPVRQAGNKAKHQGGVEDSVQVC